MRSEVINDLDELVVEEYGEQHTVKISTSRAGIVIGCTRLSWQAWDYILSRVGKRENYA